MPESFAAFMARALHDPQRGYYARRIQGIGGQRGDFATAATLSPLLGQAIAAWLKQSRREMPEVRHVIEVGAGNGALMETVRKSLGWWQRRKFQWHIVETSVALREQQMQRLGAAVAWHVDLKSALRACGGAAFIYHNELLDAFPVRLVQRHEGEWLDVFVEFENGRARELLRPLELKPGMPPSPNLSPHDVHRGCHLHSGERDQRLGPLAPAMQDDAIQESPTQQVASAFSVLSHPPQHAQQRCELHESVREWLHDWVPEWKRGAMLTVDYGDTFPALYRRRPRGTLRAYLMHHRLEGMSIYENAGRQDITADVNFTDYRAWAKKLGIEEIGFATQAEFLQSRVPGASGPMLDPDGAGGAFKVVMHRRVEH
jgi:SAM-dependent MidA family methyltransferase